MLTVIIVLILCIIFYFIIRKVSKKRVEEDKITTIYNQNLEVQKNKLIEENDILTKKLHDIQDNLYSVQQEHECYKVKLEKTKKDIDDAYKLLDDTSKTYDSHKQMAEVAYQDYCDNLKNKYQDADKEYSLLMNKLGIAYENKQKTLIAEIDKVNNDLDKIKASRAAAIKARIREKEIEENSSFYCLQISDIDKLDINKLNTVKATLNKPRILSMLIWQNYFQKQLKAKSAEILGTSTVTGIYKITNIITKECYIGQALNVATRWAEHCKCGLGIDTPANNKLYKAMQEYGVYNFSWELLEACPVAQLNEKEKYYIDLYDSYNYGYNSSKGIGVNNISG